MKIRFTDQLCPVFSRLWWGLSVVEKAFETQRERLQQREEGRWAEGDEIKAGKNVFSEISEHEERSEEERPQSDSTEVDAAQTHPYLCVWLFRELLGEKIGKEAGGQYEHQEESGTYKSSAAFWDPFRAADNWWFL